MNKCLTKHQSLLFQLLGIYGVIHWAFTNQTFISSASYSEEISDGYREILLISTGGLFIILGSILRTLRTKVLLDRARQGNPYAQFGDLAVSNLFNVILPFRIGEGIRALRISRRLKISFLYTFVCVIVERLFDVILLSFVLIICALSSDTGLHQYLRPGVFIFLGSTATLTFLLLLLTENQYVLNTVYFLSGFLNKQLADKIRLAVWSLIQGFGQKRKYRTSWKKYTILFFASWLSYVIGTCAVIMAFAQNALSKIAISALGPFVIPRVILGTNSFNQYLTELSRYFNSTLSATNLDALEVTTFWIWFVLFVPLVFFGLVFLLSSMENVFVHQMNSNNADAVMSLDRTATSNSKLQSFIDSYYRKNLLTRELNQIASRGELRIIENLKGSSEAITVLIEKDREIFVRKMINVNNAQSLKRQAEWISHHLKTPLVVNLISENSESSHYSIDLEFNSDWVTLFDFLHSNSLETCKTVLESTWNFMYQDVYSINDLRYLEKERDEYILHRLENRVALAAGQYSLLDQLLRCEYVTIQGKLLDGFDVVLRKIRSNPEAWNNLAYFRSSARIHGDLTVDNLLVHRDLAQPVIIDPSDDNQLSGPVIDIARHLQSLVGGYEFLNQLETPPIITIDPTGKIGEISYVDMRSTRYDEIYMWSMEILQSRLIQVEINSLPFHVGLLFGRMLPHRVRVNAKTAPIYFAKSLEFLNQYLAQNTKERTVI